MACRLVAGILLVGRLGTNFSEILIQLLAFSFKKMRLKVSTAKCRLFFLVINVLKGRNYHLPFLHQHRFYSNGFGGANNQSLTLRSLWDVAVILKVHFSNSLYRTLACEIAPRWMPQKITCKISSVNGLVLADPRVPLAGPRSIPSYGVSRPQLVNILQFSFMHFAIVMSPIIAKFCFASSFVPDLEANFMVTGFTTRDKKY